KPLQSCDRQNHGFEFRYNYARARTVQKTTPTHPESPPRHRGRSPWLVRFSVLPGPVMNVPLLTSAPILATSFVGSEPNWKVAPTLLVNVPVTVNTSFSPAPLKKFVLTNPELVRFPETFKVVE